MIQEKIPSNFLLSQLKQQGHTVDRIISVKPVSGGSINDSFKLATDAGHFFIKMNSASQYPGMFEAEVKGLELLEAPGVIRIPRPVLCTKYGDNAYLIMEFIDEGGEGGNSWKKFGKQLADMHRQSHSGFGLDHQNYIGSLEQSNNLKNTWAEFFAAERIEPQLKLATSYFSASERQLFEGLLSRVDQLVPVEPPSLVHGDLWSGNYLFDEQAEPVLIDPAVYFGHREMDIGMMQLFGGFSPDLFAAYNEHYPLESGWRERVDLHNLYPLLVHVNLFGSSYASQVRSILKKFS